MVNRVLFVDDEANVLLAIKRALIDEDYECEFASSGKEALDILREKEVHLIVSDMRMSGMDGIQLLKEVKQKYPKIVRIVLSGYIQSSQVIATINSVELFKYITKPWNLDELKSTIRQAIDIYNEQDEREKARRELDAKNQAYQNILRQIEGAVATAKSEANDLRKIGNLFTSHIIEELLKNGFGELEMKEHIKLCALSHKKYLSCNMELTARTINEIMQGIMSEIKRLNNMAKIDEKHKEESGRFKIPFEVINFIVITVFERLLNDNKGEVIVRLFGEIKREYLGSFFECSMVIHTTKEIDTHAMRYIIFLRVFIHEILCTLKGSFAIARVENNVITKIQLPVYDSKG